MSNRCESCGKMASLDTREPENIDDLDVDLTDETSANVVRATECCDDEKKEATFEIDVDVVVPAGHHGDGHELSIENESVELTDAYRPPGRPARYQKHFIGIVATGEIVCSCGKTLGAFRAEDESQASSFDDV